MNFLGMGVLEIAVILLVAFLVLGPSKSIHMARTAGKVIRDLRGTFTGIVAATGLNEDELIRNRMAVARTRQPEEQPPPL